MKIEYTTAEKAIREVTDEVVEEVVELTNWQKDVAWMKANPASAVAFGVALVLSFSFIGYIIFA